MSDHDTAHGAAILADQAAYLIATAARAPSVHNTQPWRFRVDEDRIDLYADQRRKLRVDPMGREMLISCGAALFGLRLAIRSLGYLPVVSLLPDRAQLRLLAQVSLGAAAPMTTMEREMLAALPHRHTHRGAFTEGPLPTGLMPGLQHDALAEGATLAVIGQGLPYQQLADVVAAASARQGLDPAMQADMRQWSRAPASRASDGIPAHAFAANTSRQRGRLPQRDFDLGRDVGTLAPGGAAPADTAILLTSADGRADWLRAGQALHRVLAHAASRWVFASLHTQPLEAASIRELIRDRLALPGAPQIILQLGPADTTRATARRPPSDLIEP